MRYFLENDVLKVEVDSFGAEVKSILKKDGYREYMWYGNGKYWGRTSPVLFPFVGSLKNKSFSWQGKEYAMGQHGFARDLEFTKMKNDPEGELWFELTSNEQTMMQFPFPFVLQIGYVLQNEVVTVKWIVKNPAPQDLYFSIGAHPAFLCPVHGENSKAGYKLRFAGAKQIHHHGNDTATGMALMDEDIVLELQNERVTITQDFFDRCTYMVEGRQTDCVTLEDPAGKPIVSVSFDAPLFAVWSPEGKNAPFLCIEPWYGRCDSNDFCGDISQRAYTNHLAPNEVFTASYQMRFHS